MANQQDQQVLRKRTDSLLSSLSRVFSMVRSDIKGGELLVAKKLSLEDIVSNCVSDLSDAGFKVQVDRPYELPAASLR